MASLTYLNLLYAMRHLVRSILFAALGSFAGLDRTGSSFRMTLVRVGLPLGLSGRFPLPLVLGRTMERLGRPMTVAGPRDWTERVQSFLLRRVFGLEAMQAYREIQKKGQRQRRERIREIAAEKVRELSVSNSEEILLLGKLSDNLMDLTERSEAVKMLGSGTIATEQEVVAWANRHLDRDRILPIPLA
jgi:hypothetical protein